MNIDKAKLIEAIENSCYGQNYVQYDDILKIINSIPTTEPKLPTVESIENILARVGYEFLFKGGDKSATSLRKQQAQAILTLLKSKQPE